ncbi:MAG: MogA/MoaB family molybdenum cofactor biosynthesis protein [Anaerolineae bacterium]|nr:MogA/MoaB family molybdenum cofactor biosynthesis protein [Anaerolineae bacterium]MDW8298033.1 MogA/MoaB family molybdenum cofactor biosynthesis protein [Anaerolineae bacterium]
MGAEAHRELAGRSAVTLGIVTVSDTRTPQTDENGIWLRQTFESLGHRIAAYRIVRDEPEQVETVLEELVSIPELQIALFNGGTGIAPRDTTYDVIARKLEKTLSGFGELFRMLSYQQVGAAAMLSRATAGVYRGKLIVSMPGSPKAVKLAVESLILPELNHLAWEIARRA